MSLDTRQLDSTSMPRVDAHRIGEERSLELHRRIASRLQGEPELVAKAAARLRRWREAATVSEFYAQRWAALLEGPLEELVAAMTDDGEAGRELRQSTPFANTVAPRDRWRIWREVRQRLDREHQ